MAPRAPAFVECPALPDAPQRLLALHAAEPDRFPAFLDSAATAGTLGRYSILFAAPGEQLPIPSRGRRDLVTALLEYGGFPEPFLVQSARTHRRWQKERLDRFFGFLEREYAVAPSAQLDALTLDQVRQYGIWLYRQQSPLVLVDAGRQRFEATAAQLPEAATALAPDTHQQGR